MAINKAVVAEFDAIKGSEIFFDRPIVNAKNLGDSFKLVKGFLVDKHELNLPVGAIRPDGKTTWPALVIHLTQATNALEGEKVVDVQAGREVYIACNDRLEDLLCQINEGPMIEIAMLPDGEIKIGGKNPMPKWRVKPTGNTLVRTGGFLNPQYVAELRAQLGAGNAMAQLNGSISQAALP